MIYFHEQYLIVFNEFWWAGVESMIASFQKSPSHIHCPWFGGCVGKGWCFGLVRLHLCALLSPQCLLFFFYVDVQKLLFDWFSCYLFCAHSREYWLSRTAERGGEREKTKRRGEERKIRYLGSQHNFRRQYLSQQSRTNQQFKCTLRLLPKKKTFEMYAPDKGEVASFLPSGSGLRAAKEQGRRWSGASPFWLENVSVECVFLPF